MNLFYSHILKLLLYLVSGIQMREKAVSLLLPSPAYSLTFHYAGRQSGGSGLGVSSLAVKGPSPADSASCLSSFSSLSLEHLLGQELL